MTVLGYDCYQLGRKDIILVITCCRLQAYSYSEYLPNFLYVPEEATRLYYWKLIMWFMVIFEGMDIFPELYIPFGCPTCVQADNKNYCRKDPF